VTLTIRAPRSRALLAVAACLAIAASTAHAATYKWTDANGRVVYSDQPPAGNVRYETIGAAPPPANPEAAKELATRDAEFRKRQTDVADAASKAEKANAEAVRQRNYCQQLRTQIAGMSQANVALYRLDDKGQRVMLSDVDRKAEVERLTRTAREQSCP